MKRTIQAALVAVALAAPMAAPIVTHAADVSVQFNSGSVAYGYNDGYWDRTHAWHAWPSDRDRDAWHTQYHEHYYDQTHTVLPNGGWRTDTWWTTH